MEMHRLLVALLICLGCLLPAAQATTMMRSGGDMPLCHSDNHTQTDYGSLSLHIALKRARFPLGSRVPIAIQTRNTSDKPTVIWLSGFWPNHRLIVTDSDGREPPLSSVGQEQRRRFEQTAYQRKNTPLTLKPGEVWSWPAIDIAQLYELRAGSYRAQVVYDETRAPNPSCAASNIFAFEVIAAR